MGKRRDNLLKVADFSSNPPCGLLDFCTNGIVCKGSIGGVRKLRSERSLLARPACCANGRFLVFSARTGLIGKGSKGSIAVADDLSKVPEIRAKGASLESRRSATF